MLHSTQTLLDRINLLYKMRCIGCHSKMSRLLRAWWEEGGEGNPSVFWVKASQAELRWGGEKWPFILDGIENERELTVIQTAFHADPRLRISHASTVRCTGRTVTPVNRAPEKRLSKKKDTLYLNDVWLPLRVKCSLHNWKHLPALHWFWYNYGSSFGCNGSTFPLNTVGRSTNIILFIWLGEGVFTFCIACTTKSNPCKL